jgi:hypothetical protein
MRKEPDQTINRAELMRAFNRRVWQEIQYLEPCNREDSILPDSKSVAPGQLELLDDQVRFPWTVLLQWATVVVAAACAIVIVLVCNYC